MPQQKSSLLASTVSARRDAIRLLRDLAMSSAYAFVIGADEPGRLALVAPSNGVSLRRRSAAASAGEWLVAEGLAEWERPGRARRGRLVISQAGISHLARLDAAPANDPFAAQNMRLVRATVAAPEGGTGEVALDAAESPLAWLARRRGKAGRALIEPAALQAGERLRADLTLARTLPHVTLNWSRSGASGGAGAGANYSDLVIAARQRVDAACAAVGADMSGLLIDVCGFLKGLEVVEQERGWPPRSAKVVLVMALARLARHYGYAAEARGPVRSAGIRAWGAEGYRPEM